MKSITATFGAYTITKAEDAKITVTKDGVACANAIQAIRDIAEESGFEVDPAWNTQTAGAKLIKFLLTETAAEELSDKKHQGPNKDGLSRLGERFQFGLKKASEKAGQVMDDVKEREESYMTRPLTKPKKQ